MMLRFTGDVDGIGLVIRYHIGFAKFRIDWQRSIQGLLSNAQNVGDMSLIGS